jgi:hypothetical protein
LLYEHRGALRGTPGSAYPQPEPNATELPSSAPGRPKLVRAASLRAFAFADTRRGTHRLRALARRRAPKRTPRVTKLQTSSRFVRNRSAPSAPRDLAALRALAPVTELQTSSRFARAESFSTFGAARPCRASRPRPPPRAEENSARHKAADLVVFAPAKPPRLRLRRHAPNSARHKAADLVVFAPALRRVPRHVLRRALRRVLRRILPQSMWHILRTTPSRSELLRHDENLHAPVLRGAEHLYAIILLVLGGAPAPPSRSRPFSNPTGSS